MSWAASGIVGGYHEALICLILFTITVIIFSIIVYYGAGAVYRRAALYNLESVKRYKKTDIKNLSGRHQSPVKAIFKKEWKLLLRSTIYATNSLTGVIMALFLIIIPALTEKDSEFEVFARLDSWYSLLILAGAIGFFTSLNVGATTVVSREGKAFWLVKALPVSFRQQALAKLIFGLSIPVFWGIPLTAAFVLIFHIPFLLAVLGFVLGMLVSTAATAAGMIFDFVIPKLVWINEAEAMKQNLNAMLGMIPGVVFIGVLGVSAYLLIVYTSFELWAVCALISVLSVAFAALSIAALLRIGEKSLERLEA